MGKGQVNRVMSHGVNPRDTMPRDAVPHRAMPAPCLELGAAGGRWSGPLPARLRRLRRAGRLVNWLSIVSPSRNRAEPTAVRRIGVIMQRGIGDAVLMAPLLSGLRAAYPRASIELIGKPWLGEIFGDTGLADRVHRLTPPWAGYAGKYRFWRVEWRSFVRALLALRRIRFDLLINARYDPREVLEMRVLDAGMRVGYGDRAGRRWLDVDLGVAPQFRAAAHASVSAARVAEALTDRPVDPRPRLPVPADVVASAAAALEAAGYTGGRIVAVCMDAGDPIREWRVDGFERALRGLPADVGLVVRIADPARPVKELTVPDGIPHTLWRGRLRELRGLLSIVDLLVCADSGVMHLAAACGCPVVAVFGPTWKAWFGPSGEGDEVVMVEPMPCRPCFDLCIHDRPICMDRLAPERVGRAVQRRLSTVGTPRIEQNYRAQYQAAHHER